MQTQEPRYQVRVNGTWLRLLHQSAYLPGAVVSLYGFWQSPTA